MIRALRKIPVPLLFAQLAGVLIPLFLIVMHEVAPHAGDRKSAPGMLLVESGYAIPVLSIVGLAWLARGLAGVARTGVRIAMFATAAGLVILLVGPLGLFLVDASPNVIHVKSVVQTTCAVAVAVGLGIATRRWIWIPIGALAAFVALPPLFAWGWFYDGYTGEQISWNMHQLEVVEGAVQLAMVILVSRQATAIEEPAPVGRGFARGGLALRGLAIATAVLAGLNVLLGTQYHHESHTSLLWLSAVVIAFEFACLFVLTLGALSTICGRSELPAWLVVAGSGVALAVAGYLAMGVNGLVLRLLWEFPASSTREVHGGLVPSVSSQLLLALAIAALLVALAIAARRRGLEELRARAITSTCALVGLAIAAITGQELIADIYELTSFAATILVVTNAALVAAWLLASRVVRSAAGELTGGQYLPTAKVIQ